MYHPVPLFVRLTEVSIFALPADIFCFRPRPSPSPAPPRRSRAGRWPPPPAGTSSVSGRAGWGRRQFPTTRQMWITRNWRWSTMISWRWAGWCWAEFDWLTVATVDVGGVPGGEHKAEAGAQRGEKWPGDGQTSAGGSREEGETIYICC